MGNSWNVLYRNWLPCGLGKVCSKNLGLATQPQYDGTKNGDQSIGFPSVLTITLVLHPSTQHTQYNRHTIESRLSTAAIVLSSHRRIVSVGFFIPDPKTEIPFCVGSSVFLQGLVGMYHFSNSHPSPAAAAVSSQHPATLALFPFSLDSLIRTSSLACDARFLFVLQQYRRRQSVKMRVEEEKS